MLGKATVKGAFPIPKRPLSRLLGCPDGTWGRLLHAKAPLYLADEQVRKVRGRKHVNLTTKGTAA